MGTANETLLFVLSKGEASKEPNRPQVRDGDLHEGDRQP